MQWLHGQGVEGVENCVDGIGTGGGDGTRIGLGAGVRIENKAAWKRRRRRARVAKALLARISKRIVLPLYAEGFRDHRGRLWSKVMIETTSMCNNNCGFCPVGYEVDPRPKMTMSNGVFQRIICDLQAASWAGTIALYCNNEPLLDRYLADRIRLVHSDLPGSSVYISTNGIRLTAALTTELFDAGLNHLIINNYADDLELTKPLSRFVGEFDVNDPRITFDFRLKNEVLNTRAGNAPNKAAPAAQHGFCRLPFTDLNINARGDVFLCCQDALWETVLGNIADSTLSEIWFSDRYVEIRERLLDGDRSCTASCINCDVYGIKAPIRDYPGHVVRGAVSRIGRALSRHT
jgi:radical SAM protein with 4Fe4S-binding SPASM domain